MCQHAGKSAPCDCTEARRKLEDLLRRELCEAEAAPILEHIEGCLGCQEEQRVSEALTEAVKRCCREQAPPEVRDELLAKLERL